MAHAQVLDTNEIRQNIVSLRQYGHHCQCACLWRAHSEYIDNITYCDSTVIEYPENGPNGKSILNTTDSIYNQYQYYGLMTTRPNDCVSLKLVIERQFFGCQYGCWFYL